MDQVTVEASDYRLGEEKPVRIIVVDTEANSDLSTATVTIEIYDSTGSTTLAATSATLSGTTRLLCLYQLTTGSGKTITTAGTYRAVWRMTYGTTIREWEQTLNVYARPS